MRLVVFGATGRIGRAVVSQARAAGHTVSGLSQADLDVREPIPPEFVDGSDAVVFAAGKPGRGPSVVRSMGMANVVKAMDSAGVKRVLAVMPSAVHISPGAPLTRKIALRFFVHKLYRNPFLDLERMEDELHHSSLDWTVVRTAALHDGPPTGRIVAVPGTVSGPERGVSVADLAAYLVSHADDSSLHRATVTLTGQR
jgi:nucleoside-diphosphate-sugar epimerase